MSYPNMQDRTVIPIQRNPAIRSSPSRTAQHRLRVAATLSLALSLPALVGLAGCNSKSNPVDPAEVNAAQAGPPQDANGNVLLSDGTYGPPPQGAPAQPAASGPAYPTVPRASAPATPQVAPRASYASPARGNSYQPQRASYVGQPSPGQQYAESDQYPAQQQNPPDQYPAQQQNPDQGNPDQGNPDQSGYPQQDPGGPYETQNPYDNQTYQQDAYNDGYQQGYEAGIEASQPPPSLPVYEQPPCPGDDYIWNPGYWHYSRGGYYWVPGAWVLAPYTGALWTPAWWGFFGGHYRFHHGYWGPHIGFYGGIPYGYGYTGQGFHGGYWDHDHFRYNRAVTNVRIINVTNTYNTVVVNNVVNNRHVSYNGGQGGLSVRPTPSEFAAMREQHIRPLPAQNAHVIQASQNRQQYANVNQGRPPVAVATRPIQVQRLNVAPTVINPGVRGVNHPTPPIAPTNVARPGQPVAPNSPGSQPTPPQSFHTGPQPVPPANGARPTAPGAAHPAQPPSAAPSGIQPNHTFPGQQRGGTPPAPSHSAPIQQRPVTPAQPAPNRPQQPTYQRPSPIVRPQAPMNPPPAQTPAPRQEPRTFSPPPEARPQPQPRPQIQEPRPEPPRPEPQRPQPRPQVEQPRPQPQPRPQMEQPRPQPQPRPQVEQPRPQPQQPRPEPARPAPHAPAHDDHPHG